LRSCPEIVIWLAVVGGTTGPLPAFDVLVTGVAAGEVSAAAEDVGFGFAGRGLARLGADTRIVGRTVAGGDAGRGADEGEAALGEPSAGAGCAVCANTSGHRNENSNTIAANARDAMHFPNTYTK
jgi:hypothetical protein